MSIEEFLLRSRRRRPSGPHWMRIKRYLLIASLLTIFARPTTGAFINFQNCLSPNIINNKPPILQFVPLHVAAVFNTTDPSHNLNITVWGNVTGSNPLVVLPPPDDPSWSNPNRTDGKIIHVDPTTNTATTLLTKVNVLSYMSYSDDADFCTQLINGSCPLGPSFRANG